MSTNRTTVHFPAAAKFYHDLEPDRKVVIKSVGTSNPNWWYDGIGKPDVHTRQRIADAFHITLEQIADLYKEGVLSPAKAKGEFSPAKAKPSTNSHGPINQIKLSFERDKVRVTLNGLFPVKKGLSLAASIHALLKD